MRKKPHKQHAAGIVALFVFVTCLSYVSDAHFFALKELVRALFLFPVLLSAYLWGKKGGILSSCVAVASYIPFIARSFYAAGNVSPHTAELFSGAAVLFFLGAFFGALFDSDRRAMEKLLFFASLKDDSYAEKFSAYVKELSKKDHGFLRLVEDRLRALKQKAHLMEEAVASRRSFQQILDALPACVLLEDENGKALFANEKLRFDFTEDTGGHFHEMSDTVMTEMQREARKWGTLVYNEHHFEKSAHNKLYGMVVLCVPSLSGFLKNDAALFVLEDITHRKKLLTLQETQDARDDFFSGISHDMKSPLSAVKGYLAEVKTRGEHGIAGAGTVSDAAIIASMQYCFGRMKRFAHDLLDVARLEAGKPFELEKSKVRIVDVVRGEVNALKSFSPMHSFEVRSEGNSEPILQADEKRLQQILFNVLGNAVKYSPRGGKITVVVEEKEDAVVVCVRDEGVGIPDDELKNIFKKFYRVRGEHTRRIQGTGFGLYLVKSLVELHGGRIHVESAPDHGTSFYVVFPLTVS